eukprot:EG_transcript_44153
MLPQVPTPNASSAKVDPTLAGWCFTGGPVFLKIETVPHPVMLSNAKSPMKAIMGYVDHTDALGYIFSQLLLRVRYKEGVMARGGCPLLPGGLDRHWGCHGSP